jgi:lysophospholipase L1-like esterase
MLSTSDHCYKPPGRQLFAAEKYFEKEGNAYGLATIDLGFNDVRACLLQAQVDETCATKGITEVQNDMPKILADLKASAGPNVHFIGLEYGDPFLEHYLLGASEFGDATNTLTVIIDLNNALHAAFTAAGIPTANVPGAFRLVDTSPTTLKNVGTVPQNVASECAYTWMCTPPPFGPDDHPNNAGYAVIAAEIESKLPPSWR